MAMVTTATDIKFNTVWMFLINLQAPPEAEVKSSAAIPTAGAKNAAATKAAVATFSAVKRDFFGSECFSFEISYVYYRLMWKKIVLSRRLLHYLYKYCFSLVQYYYLARNVGF